MTDIGDSEVCVHSKVAVIKGLLRCVSCEGITCCSALASDIPELTRSFLLLLLAAAAAACCCSVVAISCCCLLLLACCKPHIRRYCDQQGKVGGRGDNRRRRALAMHAGGWRRHCIGQHASGGRRPPPLLRDAQLAAKEGPPLGLGPLERLNS